MDRTFPRLLVTDHFVSEETSVGTFRIVSPFLALEKPQAPESDAILEEVELHFVESAVSLDPARDTDIAQLQFVEDAVAIEGQATGSYHRFREPDSHRVVYELIGSIQLYGLGHLELSGEIFATSGVSPRISGELYLTTDVGTIALSLAGRAERCSDSLPSSVPFTVTRATGPFCRAGGSGVLYITQSSLNESSGTIYIAVV